MKFNVYAIKDTEKGVYLQPFFVPFFQKTEDTIIDFKRNLKAAESVLTKFPENFELHHIGEFYDQKGAIVPIEIIKLVSVDELLKEKKEDVGNTEIN